MNGFDLLRLILFSFVSFYILDNVPTGTFLLVVGAWALSDILCSIEHDWSIKDLEKKYDKATKRNNKPTEGK
jgi:hypothetical protein